MEKTVLIRELLLPHRELFMPAFSNFPKVMKQRLMSSTIVYAVRTGMLHNLTGRGTDQQHIRDYKVNSETMECDCGWPKLHTWPDRYIFRFTFKMGAMNKIKVPRHRSIEQCLRQYPRNMTLVIHVWYVCVDGGLSVFVFLFSDSSSFELNSV